MLPGGGPRARRRPGGIAIALALALLAALPYLAAGTGGFVNLDDDLYVTGNRVVRDGLSAAGVRWAFTQFHAANWHPLAWLSHMLDVSLFGLDPRGHHLTSVLLHGLAAALLFTAVARLTGALWRSALVAALFAAHPLRVESVAWVAERKDVLAGLCFMLLLLGYERYARRGGAARYLAVVALLALGLTAKPMLVTAPAVLLLLDFWPLGRLRPGGAGRTATQAWRTAVAEKLPLLALSVASAAVTFLAQRAGDAVRPLELITPAMRGANALTSLAAYLGKTAWPADLAVYYPYPLAGIPPARVAFAALLAAALTVAAFRGRRSRPHLAVGWGWHVVMLLPVIGIVQAGEQALADRYTYLPLVGPVLAAVWLAPELVRPRGGRAGGAAALAAVAAVCCLAALTVRQAGFWWDSETLFRRALAVTGDGNWLAHKNLAAALREKGEAAEALEHLQEVLRLAPAQRGETYGNIGNALVSLGRVEDALPSYRMAVSILPESHFARYNLALALAALGRSAEAEAAYREAIRLRSDFAAARSDLGRLLAALGRTAEAEESYREAIRLDPGLAAAHTNLAVLLARGGRLGEAEAGLREAARLAPELAEPQVNLGFVLMSQGRHGEAEAAYREALRRTPESHAALAGLGRALAAQGRREAAADAYREALRLNPGAEGTRRDLEALAAR